MSIEDEMFENTKLKESELLKYGFSKKNDYFYYKTSIYNQEFDVMISISKSGTVSGTMIDKTTSEEFLNFRLQNLEGTFISKIKEEYTNLLVDIKEKCFQYTPKENYWVVPANTKHYDVMNHFKNQDTITWRQSANIELHDIVYIYIGSPISAIMFKCEAVKVNFVGEHANTMELKCLEKYQEGQYPLVKLRAFDLKAIRGTRKVPEKTITLLS